MRQQAYGHLRPWQRGALLVFALLLAVACATFVPQQGWSQDAGPVVPHDSFPSDCSLCHVGGDWHTLRQDFEFDHLAKTGYALEGAHKTVGCLLCHNDRGPVQQFSARGCAGCHEDPHTGRLGANCKDCHEEKSWYPREAIAQHDRTRFPLVGAHAAVACFRCHPGAQVGNFAGADKDCFSCHSSDFARPQDPNHVLLNFSHDCQTCHAPVGWLPSRFDHPASFPLTQGHAGRLCRECHTTPNTFTGLSTDCASCHTGDYQATTEPSHAAASFATGCEQCHSTRTWQQANWQHPGAFAMTFGHAGRRCTECHTGQVYSGTQTDCASCHLDNYQATHSPNHAAVGFGTDCQQCHDTRDWHGAVGHPNSFPLTNAHNRACIECHTTPGVYTGLSTTCVSCHLSDYQGTTQPNHVALAYSTDCTNCHGTATWHGATTSHPASFPLTNGHNQACTACHTTPGTYSGLSTQCSSCHLPDYQATTSPNHQTSGFSTDCAGCHFSTSTWQGATTTHPATFPLTNAHNRTCTACHTTPGTYGGLSTQCVSCHLSDYNGATNPPHASFQMSQQCQDCHGTTNWSAGGWTHHFPIHSGAHNNIACFSCHNNPANRILFSCIDCHEHRQSKMNSEHQGVSGYSWTTAACYQCHPTGHG